MARFLALVVGLVGAAAAAVAILDYFDIRLGAPGPSYRVEYYRLRGATADLLVQGLLTEQMEEVLGGPQEIVNNEVLDTARDVLEHFREPLNGDVVSFNEAAIRGHPKYRRNAELEWTGMEVEDYADAVSRERRSRVKTEDWRAYIGGNSPYHFYLPDLPALDTFLQAHSVPSGYRVYHTEAAHGRTMPHLWRFLQRRDLDAYNGLMAEYLSRVQGRRDAYGFDHPNIIDGLRWLTRNGMPSNFIYVLGEAQAHLGWSIYGVMRDLEVEVLVIENLTNRPMTLGEISYRSWGGDRLRTEAATNANIEGAAEQSRTLIPSGVLAPGEKIVIPTRISFVHNFEPPELTQPRYADSAVSPDLVNVPIYWRDQHADNIVYAAMPRNEILSNRGPQIVERFDYGSTWLAHQIIINGESLPIRRADWQNMGLTFGFEKGSCPFVFTRTDRHGPWISEGHVLFGAVTESSARDEVKPLDRFDGSLVLRELEDEIAYIRAIGVLVDTPDGATIVLRPSNVADREITVTRASEATLVFSDFRPGFHRNPRLSVRGYYRPFALTNVEVGR